ncbi:MAG: YIP1 family protein [Pseudomonadota bacterium]
MFELIAGRVIDTYREPRMAARMAIGELTSITRALLVLGLAFCVGSILSIVLGALLGASSPGAGGSAIVTVLSGAISQVVAFFFIVVVILLGGRLFGGTGNFTQIAAITAWHHLAVAIIAPLLSPDFMIVAVESATGISLLAISIASLVSLWLQANLIAEAHGFRSVVKVMGVMIGIGLVVFWLVLIPLLRSALVA